MEVLTFVIAGVIGLLVLESVAITLLVVGGRH